MSNKNFLPKISSTQPPLPNTVEGTRLPLIKPRIDINRRSINNYTAINNEVKPDASAYVFIQDPKLRQIVLLLINSESRRKFQKIDPSFLTKINHSKYNNLAFFFLLFINHTLIILHSYSILFSKNGQFDFGKINNKTNNNDNKVETQTKQIQTDSIKFNINNINTFNKTASKSASTQTDLNLFEKTTNNKNNL